MNSNLYEAFLSEYTEDAVKFKMPIEVRAILNFFAECMGRFMIILGIFCIFVAVFFMSAMYQWDFCSSWLFGVTLVIIGSALHRESFKWKVPSIDGFATILTYIGPWFIAAAVTPVVFAVPQKIYGIPSYGGVDPDGSPFLFVTPGNVSKDVTHILVRLERPYAHLAGPLVLTGLGLLGFGCLLKFVRQTFTRSLAPDR